MVICWHHRFYVAGFRQLGGLRDRGGARDTLVLLARLLSLPIESFTPQSVVRNNDHVSDSLRLASRGYCSPVDGVVGGSNRGEGPPSGEPKSG